MPNSTTPPADWTGWLRRLQSIVQAGITYARDPFDRDRYRQLGALTAELGAALAGQDPDAVGQLLRLEKGYPTPKVDIRAVVPKADQLLFVKEVTDQRWSLPGGWADTGESASEVCAREVQEESGYTVRPVRLLAVYDKAKHAHPQDYWYTYKIFIHCELVQGEARTGFETTDVRFFGEHDLPSLSTPRITPGQIARVFELLRNPHLPADFD